MEQTNTIMKILNDGSIGSMERLLTDRPELIITAMHILINSTNNTEMAEKVLKFYKPTYQYQEIVERFLDEPDYHIEFKLENIHPNMQKWVKIHADTFLRPFKIIRKSRFHHYIIKIYNFPE